MPICHHSKLPRIWGVWAGLENGGATRVFSHFTTPLPLATGVPDEERSIERDTRRGGRERGERRERREGLA